MNEYLSFFHTQLTDPERIPVALMAMLVCAVGGMVTGPMHGNANPFYWVLMDGVFGKLGRRLDRTQRKPADLMTRGFMLMVAALFVSYFVGQSAAVLADQYPLYGVTQIVLLALTLTVGAPWFALLRVYGALDKGQKVSPGAYANIARTGRTDLSRSDDYGVTRVTMAMMARCFDKGLVAPLTLFLILGLPGAYIYASLAFFAWRFGKDGYSKGFGTVSMGLEKVLGWVPMTISGSLMAAAGLFTPTGGMTRAIKALMRPGGAPYAEGGLPVTAMAHALDVSLGGPVMDLDGSAVARKWVGPEGATARLEAGHLRRALYISMMAHLLLVASLLGVMMWAARLGG